VEERNFSVPPQLGHDLFYAVKETLHNAKKYAQASKVSISLVGEGDTLRINVRDDGVGFDIDQVGAERFGLRGMRERLEKAGGKLTVHSAPGEGTNVCIEVMVRNF
jgi:signal transduction histidine kinase